MRIKFSFFLLSFFIFLAGCKKDTNLPTETSLPNQEISTYQTPELIQLNSWNDREKLFFDVYNSNKFLDNSLHVPHSQINTRDGELPDILVSTMNKIIQDNENNKFVDGTTGRIGYPLWTKSTVIGTGDGSRHIMYVPFAKENEQKTQAFLIATKDYNYPSEEVKLNIRLSSDIEKMESEELSYTTNSCQDVILFKTFDNYLYQTENQRFEDAFCASCFEDHPNVQPNIAIQRECVDVELVICFDDYGVFGNSSGGTTGSGGGGWTITGGGGGFSGPGFAVFGHFAYAPASNSGFGGLWSAIASFFGGTGSALGNFWDSIIDIFDGDDPKCYDWNFTDTTIETRGEGDYACQTYIVYLCSQGDWWEVVESVPCDNCGGNVTWDEYYKKVCTQNAQEFLATYNINAIDWKKAGGPTAGCCNEVGEFDETCALYTFLSSKLNLADNETCLSGNLSELTKIHSFWSKHNNQNSDECEENLSTAVADAYADAYCNDDLSDLDFVNSLNSTTDIWDIMKEQLVELIKELIADFVPGGTLATIGPELLDNVEGGQWMDAMYNSLDIVLNEADACVPVAKVASLGYGLFISSKQLKRVYDAFKKAKALGDVFLLKLYNVFRNKLNMSVSDIRRKFQWKGLPTGAKLDDINASQFFDKLKEEFGDTYAGFNGNQGYPIYKIGSFPVGNSCIFMELYPDSNSGYAWTVGFYTGSCSATQLNQLSSKFKIRFDN